MPHNIGMRVLWLTLLTLSGVGDSAAAQQAIEHPLKFDVISVREDKSSEGSNSNVPLGPGNVYSPTGGLLKATNFPLMSYISFAYKMTDYELTTFRNATPEWIKQEKFDIQARTDKQDVTKDELRMMMRSLLAERFHFVVHDEMQSTQVYALKLVKPGVLGPKLRMHRAEDLCAKSFPAKPASGPPAAPETIDGGYPTVCGGLLLFSSTDDLAHLGGRDIPLSMLVNSMTLWGHLNHPVVDQTGLNGNIDFVLVYEPDFSLDPGEEPPSVEEIASSGGQLFQQAIHDQLGLRLELQRGKVHILVLDHIEHPAAN